MTSCTSQSCTSSCSTYEGCEVTRTGATSTATLCGYYAGTIEPWTTPIPDTDSAAVASAVASVESKLIAASLLATTGAYVTSLPTANITTGAATTPPTGGIGVTTPGGGGNPGPQTTVSTIYSTVTSETTVKYPTTIGNLFVQAASIYAAAGRGPPLIESDFNLNYYTVRETYEACSVGNFECDGQATPKVTVWSESPQTVSFDGSLTSFNQHFAGCTYTNNANGGVVACLTGGSWGCTSLSESKVGCNIDVFNGYDTYLLRLAECPITTASLATVKTTIVSTIYTTITLQS